MPAMNLLSKSTAKILYLTDRTGVSDGYNKAFTLMLANSGIRRNQVILSNIYTLVPDALVKKGNRKAPGFNAEKINEITAAIKQRVEAIQPDIIVTSCPAVLGLLTDWEWDLATLDKCRGGVYNYLGITTIVTLPISAINTHVDERALKDLDGEAVGSEPYRIKNGQWILNRDWEKVGRFANNRSLQIPRFEYAVVRSIDDALAARDYLATCALVAVDIETGCYPAQITCCGFYGIKPDGTGRGFVFPFYDPFAESVAGCFWESEDDHAHVWRIMEQILESPILKTMQNGFYDTSYFVKYRLNVVNYLIDSMYMWYALYMELPKTLDFISSILLDNYQYWKDDIKGIEQDNVLGKQGLETYWRYNALDCYNTAFNSLRLMMVMQSNQMMQINYQDAFMRMVSGLNMSMRGIKADKQRHREHRVRLEAEVKRLTKRFRFMIDDPEFNISSPVQKNALFYDILGARERTERGRFVNPAKPKVKGNTRSSGKYALKMIRTEHPFFNRIVTALEDAMEPDTQLGNVFGRTQPDGSVKGGIKMFTPRFRTAFNAVGTTTQRYSSKASNFWDGTNVQNIRDEFQDWLVADDGWIFMEADYSQSDDVFMGYEANDRGKIEVIESGKDGHAVHGELFFKKPYDEIVAGKKAKDPAIVHPITGIRQITKRVVHGTNFQMAPMTLYATQMGRDATVTSAKLLGFSDAESWGQDKLVQICGYLMQQYRKKYPRFTKREFYAEIEKMLRTKGTITNAFGIERRFLGDPSDNGTQREATGFIGQSDTAGNVNRTMYEIDHGFIPERFRDGANPDARDTPLMMDHLSHGFRFLAQKHDSMLVALNLSHPKWRDAAHNLLTVMARPIIINGHTVRVRTEANFGFRWCKDYMVEWKSGRREDLNGIVNQLREMEN